MRCELYNLIYLDTKCGIAELCCIITHKDSWIDEETNTQKMMHYSIY